MMKMVNDIAIQAAKLEQQAQYGEAAKCWQQAYLVAKKEVNQLWCRYRAQFCRRMSVCPF